MHFLDNFFIFFVKCHWNLCSQLSAVTDQVVNFIDNLKQDTVTFKFWYSLLVCTKQVNIAVYALWLINSEVINKVLFTSEILQFPTSFRFIVENRVIFWSFSYLACAVYTITIMHLSVSEQLWIAIFKEIVSYFNII